MGFLLTATVVAAEEAPARPMARAFHNARGALVEVLAEELELNPAELYKALDPVHIIERLAREKGITPEELRETLHTAMGERVTKRVDPQAQRQLREQLRNVQAEHARPLTQQQKQRLHALALKQQAQAAAGVTQRPRAQAANQVLQRIRSQAPMKGIKRSPMHDRVVDPRASRRFVGRMVPQQMQHQHFHVLPNFPARARFIGAKLIQRSPAPTIEWRTEDGQLVRPRIVWERVEDSDDRPGRSTERMLHRHPGNRENPPESPPDIETN